MADKLKKQHQTWSEGKKKALGDKFITTGSIFKDVSTNCNYEITDIKEDGFETKPKSALKNAKREPVFVEFEEFSEKFNSGDITIPHFDNAKEEDKMFIYMLMMDYVNQAVVAKQGASLTKKRPFKKGNKVKDGAGKEYIVKNPISKSQSDYTQPVLDAVHIADGEEAILDLADLVLLKEGGEAPREKQKYDFADTGATTVEVNNLILFVDNTEGLAEKRDAIYKKVFDEKQSKEKLFDAFNDMFSYVAEKEWNKTFAENKIKLLPDQREEFAALYTQEFSSWKYDNALLEDGGAMPDTSIVTMYDDPDHAQRAADFLMNKFGKIYEVRKSQIEPGWFDVVLLKYKKKFGGIIENTHKEFIDYIGLKREDEVKFENDNNSYTLELIAIAHSILVVRNKQGFDQMKMLRDLREVNGRKVNIYDFAMIELRGEFKGVIAKLNEKLNEADITEERKATIQNMASILSSRLQNIKDIKFKDVPESAYMEGVEALKILIELEDKVEEKELLQKELLELEAKL